MFNKIVNINHIINNSLPLYNYGYKIWQETERICRSYIKKIEWTQVRGPEIVCLQSLV